MHVTSQRNERKPIYRDDRDRDGPAREAAIARAQKIVVVELAQR